MRKLNIRYKLIITKTKNYHHRGNCVQCNSKLCLCCQQVIPTTTFKSNQTNKTFNIYHIVNELELKKNDIWLRWVDKT